MKRTRISTLSVGALLVCVLASPSASRASDEGRDDENGNRRNGKFSAKLKSYAEVPSISSPTATGSFSATLAEDGMSLHYKISYSGLSAGVTQSHIHFGRMHTAGGIMAWLCQTDTNKDPLGLAPPCVVGTEGSVEGTLTSANIITVGTTGMGAGEFSEFVEALKNAAGYANVHSTMFPGGEIRGDIR
jgi:hypothetical protein